jgi:hypothetical protein
VVLVVEMVSKYVGQVEGINSKADLLNDILRWASPTMFKPTLAKLLEYLDADDKTYTIAANMHSAYLVRLLREHHPHLDEHANGCEAFRSSYHCNWSSCEGIDKRIHSGMILACVGEFLSNTDLSVNGYNNVVHAITYADTPALALIKKALVQRGTPIEAIAGLLLDRLITSANGCISYTERSTMRQLLRYGPILSDATIAMAAPMVLKSDNYKLIEEFCDAYSVQVPQAAVQKAILATVCEKPSKTTLKLRSYLVGRFNFDLTSDLYCVTVAVRGHLSHLREILGGGYDPTAPTSTMFMDVCAKAHDPRKITLLMDYGCVPTQAHVDVACGNSEERMLRLLMKQGKFELTNEHLVRAMRGRCTPYVIRLLLTKYKLEPSENNNAAFHAGFDAHRDKWHCSVLWEDPRFSFDGLDLSKVVRVLMSSVSTKEILERLTKHYDRDEIVKELMALRLGGQPNYSLRHRRYELVCRLTDCVVVYDGGNTPEFNPTEDGSDGYR